MIEECSDLARVVKQTDQNGGRGTAEASASRKRLRAELADLLIHVAGLANSFGLDLSEQLEDTRLAFFGQHPHLTAAEQPPVIPERIEKVTVYAASSPLVRPSFLESAEELGRLLTLEGWTVIYGGGAIGLMGAVSRGVRRQNGRIAGVILDRFLDRQRDAEVPDMKTVSTMRSRKRGLEEAGDAFLCLPGGFGTLEEVCETLSFRHLGFHYKPTVMCNFEGFWDPLLEQLERCFAEKIIPEGSRAAYQVATTPAEAVGMLRAWTPPRAADSSEAPELQSPQTR